MSTHVAAPAPVLPNPLNEERRFIESALIEAERRFSTDDGLFRPAFALPEAGPELREFFAASSLRLRPLGDEGDGVSLLDLMGNPRTRTTKTFASLVIVARAVNHIRRHNEPITIVTPSSGNKATALRDAVARAYEAGLVTGDELGIVVLLPHRSTGKLWSSSLDQCQATLRANPIAVLPEGTCTVKDVSRGAVERVADRIRARTGRRLWHTLELANYVGADAVRARALARLDPGGTPRLHVHAVSSAYGLIGHALGERMEHGAGSAQYLLVQHLNTPDMVLDLLFGSFDRRAAPRFEFNRASGLFEQAEDPHFPATTFDPAEVLDRTFYTSAPPTSAHMSDLIRRQGGSGIVVSLRECIEQYPLLRQDLADAGVDLPGDFRTLREWSLIMAVTGLRLARSRGLVDPGTPAVIHGTGCYSSEDYTPVPVSRWTTVTGVDDFAGVLENACEQISGTAS